MAFCNNTNIVGSIPTIELTGCEHGTLAVFASVGKMRYVTRLAAA